MNTSQTSFLTEIINGKDKISERKLAYFRERQRLRIYDFIIKKFTEKKANGMTRTELARRINKRPEQITRLLSNPGNWTLDTISDLTLALYAGELNFEVKPFTEMAQRNSDHLSILKDEIPQQHTKLVTSSPSTLKIEWQVFTKMEIKDAHQP